MLIMHKQKVLYLNIMWNKVSIYKCLKVSCCKPGEHPFRILVLEMCLGVTMSSRDADPKLLCSSGMRRFQGSIGSGELGFSRANWILTNRVVRYLVFCFYVFLFGLCFLIKSVKDFVLFSLDFRKNI